MRKSIIVSVASCLVFGACASAPRAPISESADLNEEVRNMEADIQTGYERHYDVLAYKDFKKSREALEDAKGDLADNDDREDVIAELSKARGFYNRATSTVTQRSEKLDGVLNARLAAINAGARKFPAEKSILKDLDDDLYSAAEDLEDLTPRQFDEMQKGYLALEAKSIQASHLGTARGQIANARKNDAKKYVPQTLERAEKDMANAENMILTSVKNPEGYSAAVVKAKQSALLLTKVLATATRDKKALPENVALELVMKDTRLNALNEELSTAQEEITSTEAKNREQQATLSKQQSVLELNKTIDSVSKEFKKNEAEVYRQGNNVLIRLKGVQFPSGRAELPKSSIALLEKVKEVAGELNSSAIVVEGHTDAVGAAAINKELSQKRAETVAEYLNANNENVSAIGYGFEKPITSNKTKEGRAQNRRVDVIITPRMAAAPTTATME